MAKLNPGFLGLAQCHGALFIVPPKRITTPPALSLIQTILEKDFGIFTISVYLRNPRIVLSEAAEEEIRAYSDMMRADGIFHQVAIYVNAQDCIEDTVATISSMSLKTIHIGLEDQLPTMEDTARKAIIQILKRL